MNNRECDCQEGDGRSKYKKKKLVIKWVSILLVAVLVFSSGTMAIADTIFTKDEATPLSVTNSNADIYEELEDEIKAQLTELNGVKEYKGRLVYSNSNNEMIYSVIADGEKIGWYFVNSDGSVDKYTYDEYASVFEIESADEKITSELKEKMEEAGDSEIPVYVWLEDIDTESVLNSIPAEMNIDANSVENEVEQREVVQIRSYYAEAYQEYNQSVVNSLFKTNSQNVHINGTISETAVGTEQSAQKVKFISSYSPMCLLNLTAEQISEISENEFVEEIGYLPEVESVNNLSTAQASMQSTYVRDTYGYKGNGAVVGIIEYASIPNVSNSELVGADITINSSCSYAGYDHATQTAIIIVGQTSGVAPECTMYATSYMDSADFFTQMEWLISQGVHVINCSVSIGQATGNYTVYDQWVDHIDMNHDILVVSTAGNFTYVSAPAMAYNGITVGAYDTNGTSTYNDDTFWDKDELCSGYIEVDGYAEKPDLLAPASVTVPGFSTAAGTSHSAALVTGIVAQMISANTNLKSQPGLLKAILLASAFRRVDDSNYGSIAYADYISDKEGVGKVDAKNAIYVISQHNYTYAYPYTSDFPITQNFTVDASGGTMRVALCWLKQNVINSGSHTSTSNLVLRTLTDLDLEIYDPNGVRVSYSQSENGNIELAEFTPTVSGTYTIKIINRGGTNTAEFLYLAWW